MRPFVVLTILYKPVLCAGMILQGNRIWRKTFFVMASISYVEDFLISSVLFDFPLSGQDVSNHAYRLPYVTFRDSVMGDKAPLSAFRCIGQDARFS